MDGSKITVVSQTPETVIFTVDKITNKTVEVRGNFGGSVAEGYLAEELEMDPATIKIYGSESDLARVAYAWVTFERDDVDSTLTVDLPFALVDEYGKPVETTAGIDSDTDTVSVTLPIKETKEVPLTVTLIEGAGATEVNSVVTITPRTVTLAGDSAILDGINKIVLGTIDLSDFPLTFEDTYSIVIDDDLENLTGETEAKVKVEIKGLVTKRFTVTNISHINLPEGYRAEIVTKSLEVTVRGAQAVIDAIKADHIRAVADLEDFDATTGSVTPPVRVYIDGVTEAQAGALKLNYKVSVNITAK